MKKIFPILIGSCLALTSYAETKTEVLDCKAFNSIRIEVPVEITLTMGSEDQVKIAGEADDLKLVQVRVTEGMLKVSAERKPVHFQTPVKLYLVAKELDLVELVGHVRLTTTNPIHQGSFEITMTGSTEADVKLNVNQFYATLLGDANLVAEGYAKNQNVKVTGDGTYRARNLQSEQADLNISGSGEMAVNVSDRLFVKVRGKGKITYKGTPTIMPDVMGNGVIQNAD